MNLSVRAGATLRRSSRIVIAALMALVCLAATSPAASAAEDPPTEEQMRERAEQMKPSAEFLPDPPSGVQPRVVGGTDVPDGKYPFQVALLDTLIGENAAEQQFCGGSLIRADVVLTAAHCVDFYSFDEDAFFSFDDLSVVAGRTDLRSDQGQQVDVAFAEVHPNWNPEAFTSDVALVYLVEPIEGIEPVQLVTPGTDALERPGTRATVTGWGNTVLQPVGPGPGGGSNFPERLQEARVPLVSDAEAAIAYTIDDVSYFDPDTMLAAGRTGFDSCQGDSGGPLFRDVPGGGHVQLGITSWGFGCAARGFPGVYTQLSNVAIGNFVQESTGGIPVDDRGGAAAVDRDVSPILECVVDGRDGTLTARFGYENRESTPIMVPVGLSNQLRGPVIGDAAPVTAFGLPKVVEGRQGRTPLGDGVFSVTFDADAKLVWQLFGRTATASDDSRRCAT